MIVFKLETKKRVRPTDFYCTVLLMKNRLEKSYDVEFWKGIWLDP